MTEDKVYLVRRTVVREAIVIAADREAACAKADLVWFQKADTVVDEAEVVAEGREAVVRS